MTTESLTTEGQDTQAADPQQTAQPQAEESTLLAGNDQQPAAEQTEGQQPEGKQSEEKAADPGAPEQYEFAAPEGKSFDATVIEAYSEVAKELNLSQDKAQKVLDKVAPVIEARQLEQVNALRAEWLTATKADTEFGGDKLDENIAIAKRGLDAYGSPALKQLLNSSGLGNHPEIIRAFYKAGQTVSEDGIVHGKAAPVSKDDVRSLYPNSKLN